MPDHTHFLIQPLIKEENAAGENVFWSLGELMHSIKSFTAKEINKLEGTSGVVWEQERFDRFVRGDKDLEEKFRYIVGIAWRSKIVSEKRIILGFGRGKMCPAGRPPYPGVLLSDFTTSKAFRSI